MKAKEFIDLVNDSSFFHADLLLDKKVRFRYWELSTDEFIKKPDMEIIVEPNALNGIQINTSKTKLTNFDIEQLSELLTLIKWLQKNENFREMKKVGDYNASI